MHFKLSDQWPLTISDISRVPLEHLIHYKQWYSKHHQPSVTSNYIFIYICNSTLSDWWRWPQGLQAEKGGCLQGKQKEGKGWAGIFFQFENWTYFEKDSNLNLISAASRGDREEWTKEEENRTKTYGWAWWLVWLWGLWRWPAQGEVQGVFHYPQEQSNEMLLSRLPSSELCAPISTSCA